MKADDLFNQVYRGATNFMTPDVMERGKSGSYYYELSKGTGIGGGTIYGVTVLSYDEANGQAEREHDLSKGGIDLKEARKYIKELATN